jgi:hypothetical protein
MTARTRLCAICHKEIAAERLEAVPQTQLCIEHARRIAKYGGEFSVTMRQESLGKAGSLKKNYGGVNIRMTRNLAAMEKLRAEYEELVRQEGDQG